MTVELPGPGPLNLPDASFDLAKRRSTGIAGEELIGPPRCVDCGAITGGHYCPECGQETRLETPTVGHFVREFIDQFIAIEGRMGRTLRVLLLKPGQLTADYVAGRRQRYVRPLKLYLSISVVFFSIFSLLPDKVIQTHPDMVKIDDGDLPATGHSAASPASASSLPTDPKARRAAEAKAIREAVAKKVSESQKNPSPVQAWGKSLAKSAGDRVADYVDMTPDEQDHAQRAVRAKLADEAPYAMFFLMPYMALLLKWFYLRNRRMYGEHLLFALHVHTFGFIVLAIGFLPLPFKFSDVFMLVIAVYMFMALRRFYGGGWKRTVWRLAWLFAFYGLAFVATAVSGVMTAVFGSSAT